MWFSAYRVLRLFLLSLLFGASAGAYYDLFRILRIARKPSGGVPHGNKAARYADFILCFTGDLFYWLTLAAAYCVFIYDTADGRLRIASLIALAAGFLVWRFTLGRIIVAAADLIIRWTRKAVRFIFGITFVPAYRLLRACLCAVCRTVGRLTASVYGPLSVAAELRRASRGYGLLKGYQKKKRKG